MRNKYLLLGAASAMMLAACSEDINQGPDNTRPVENALNLTSLSPASQAGRVSLPGQTRGPKADRLQLVAKIAPVADDDAINKNWSATGITISGELAYVSWHSNHQASVPAQNWGGAIDVIDLAALKANPEQGVFDATLVTQAVKFNGIVADGSTMYLPGTSYTNGAIVGRWTRGSLAMDTIALPGSSANSVKKDGNDLYAVTGYSGGLYKVNADFNADGVENVIDTIVDISGSFGGKYIAGNYFLRTDDKESQIVNLDGTTVRNTGAPLVSEEKFAESYTPETGWTMVESDKARHYGKHTMAVEGNYIYVAGGKGSAGENGLRVYAATGIVWQNGTNTTAVCSDGNYIYAATGAGLRVYEKFNGKDMPLYAYEVLSYDENGKPADEESTNKPVAGTTAQSSNFIAVDGDYIFVACGQSGVYVFKLNHDVDVEKKWTGIVAGDEEILEEVEIGEEGEFTIPEGPEVEGKDFTGWTDKDGNSEDKDGNPYTPGTTIKLPAGTILELTANYKDHDYAYTLTFVGFDETTTGIEGVPAAMKSDTNEFEIPNVTLVWGKRNFLGWSTEVDHDFNDPDYYKAGDKFVMSEGQTEATLYGVWSSNMSGNVGDEEEEKPVTPPSTDPVIGGEDSNDKE